MCVLSFKENGKKISCSVKVHMMKNYGRHCVGCVLEDVGDKYWKVQLTPNHSLAMKNTRFDRDEGIYQYHNYNGSNA